MFSFVRLKMLVKNSNKLYTSLLTFTFFCFFGLVHGKAIENTYDELSAKTYLEKLNRDMSEKFTESSIAEWDYESNITDETLRHKLEVSANLANFTKNYWLETVKFPWKSFEDPYIRRQFKKYSILGTAVLPPEKYERYNKIISEMEGIYAKAKVCDYNNRTKCDLQLEPELSVIFRNSRDADERAYYWEQWRNAAGKPVRNLFKEYVKLSNEAAVLNNFTDTSEFWLKDYESSDFKEKIEELWVQVRPLYVQLHAYVRRRLREFYGEERVPKAGPIPAHLFGNMWTQSWSNIYDLAVPYPGKKVMNITANMIEQGYTPIRMFKLAEQFFTSLNLSPMPDTFWKNSIIEKPTDGRELVCHASAWDFYDGKDFRIKQCTRVAFGDLTVVHHEMGHVQYFLQYKNQPFVYKEGANPGFHEAIGDIMALSVSTPKHLRRIGLLNDTEDDEESEINQLFNMALDKIAFLPFGYLMDQYRWSVFQGKTTEADYNKKWWQLRELYQGLSPSVARTEEDFDPGAKYHTVGNVPYIRYFVSSIIQFQFHRSLCIAAKEYDPLNPHLKPLHKCDIYQSKEAGALLKKMLELGSSKPWPEAMEVLTGTKSMDAHALLEYFAILKTWLEKENARTGEFIGWESSAKTCQTTADDDDDDDSLVADKKGKCKFAVAPIRKNKVKLFTTLRNLEGDNSYAEFVQQDDNSFGVPEYLEETKPSYHLSLRHSSKQGYEEKVVPIPCSDRTTPAPCKEPKIISLPCNFGKNGIKPEPDNDQCQSDKPSKPKKPEKCKSSVCEIRLLQKKPECERKKTAEPKKSSCITVSNLKVAYNQPFKVRSKSDDQQRVKILNVILNDGYPLKNFKQARLNLVDDNGRFGYSYVQPNVFKRTSKKNDFGGFKKKKDNSIASDKQKEAKEQDESKEEDNRSELIGSMKKSNKIDDPNRANLDLLMEAETVKNKAQEMLKSLNFSTYAKQYIDADGYMNTHREDFPQLASNTFNNLHGERMKYQNFFPLSDNSKQRLYDEREFVSWGKNSKAASRKGMDNLEAHFRRRDSMETAPIQGFEKKERRTKKKSSDKNPSLSLVGTMSDDLKTAGKVKKSYKEYHYSVRTPVIYNSIVISNSGKLDKANDVRYRRGELSKSYRRREFKKEKRKIGGRRKRKKPGISRRGRMAIFMVKMSKPVRKKHININNILQYFGLTNLSLNMSIFLISTTASILLLLLFFFVYLPRTRLILQLETA